MKRIDDMKRWTEAALDTPFQPDMSKHGYPPGACVKSREKDKDGRWPRYFGKVVEYDTSKDYALVRSYGSRFDAHGADPALAGVVWEGTVSECLKMWEID